jgi:hypothetical protein
LRRLIKKRELFSDNTNFHRASMKLQALLIFLILTRIESKNSKRREVKATSIALWEVLVVSGKTAALCSQKLKSHLKRRKIKTLDSGFNMEQNILLLLPVSLLVLTRQILTCMDKKLTKQRLKIQFPSINLMNKKANWKFSVKHLKNSSL